MVAGVRARAVLIDVKPFALNVVAAWYTTAQVGIRIRVYRPTEWVVTERQRAPYNRFLPQKRSIDRRLVL